MLESLRRGNKIEAIKRVRELTGMGLADAKQCVEAMEAAKIPAAERTKPATGCTGVLVLGLLIVAALAVVPSSLSAMRTLLAGLTATAATTPLTGLPRYELKISPQDLAQLEQNPESNETRPASFIADGKEYSVRVRIRGAWARSWPKKPLKIFFESDQEFNGNHCLNLNPAWRDASFIREPLAYHVYAACGVPAPAARMVRVEVNGQFRGLYVDVEQPDKAFLKRHKLKGAAVYKANSHNNRADERDLGDEKSFAREYEKETRKGEGYEDLQLFCHELATTRNLSKFFTNQVDRQEYINYLAASVLVQNWDWFNKNHFLVHDDRGSGKWLMVPWDLDRTFGDHWRGAFDEAKVPVLLGGRKSPGPTGWNRMEDRFFNEPTLRRAFLDRLQELLEKEFTTDKLFPILDQYEARLAADAALDRKRWPASGPGIHSGMKEVKHFVEARRAFLLREVAKLRR